MTTTHGVRQEAALMDAVVQHGYGGPEVLRTERVPVPAPGAGEVLIEVRAAAVDRGTWHIMTGTPLVARLGLGLRTPRQPIAGLDVAGVVTAVGTGTTRFRPGDEVFGTARGSLARYAVAAERHLAIKPPSVPFRDAAATPVSGTTALRAVRTIGRVAAGQRVLVLGASGGVGSFAVQLAAGAGARVTGVASAAKADLVRSLGAERVLDHRTDDVLALPDRFDLVVDINGRLPVRRLRRLLTPTGTLVIVGGEGGGALTGGLQRQLGARLRSLGGRRRLTFFVGVVRAEALEELARLLTDGTLKPAVGSTYPLQDAPHALADLEAGRVRGKAVVLVD
jgi:NADPH:quinone reductase-like Zn-dependent oxidoreductase